MEKQTKEKKQKPAERREQGEISIKSRFEQESKYGIASIEMLENRSSFNMLYFLLSS